MSPVGFDPTISVGEGPKTYALDRAATGTSNDMKYLLEITARLAVVVTEGFFRLCHERVLRNNLATSYSCLRRAGIAQSVLRLATGLMVGSSNPGGGKRFSLFHTWVPSSLLYNGYRGSSGGKAAVVWCSPPTAF